MNIPVATLKKYQKLSAHVRSNGILPIHKYLRFGEGHICKNVGHSFVTMAYDAEAVNDPVILVSEDDLYPLLGSTVSSFISINIVKGKVELNDGRDRFLLQQQDKKTFINPPTADGEPIPLSEEFIKAMAAAANFAIPVKDGPEYYNYVHIGEGAICAGEGFVVYHYPIEEPVKIVLLNYVAEAISVFKIESFLESENYYFFYNGEVTFGYVKPTISWFDIRKLFQQKREHIFTVGSSDLLSFNNLTMKLTQNPIVTLSNGKMEMDDVLLDKHHEREVPGLKVPSPFTYNPTRMNVVLKSIDVEELDFAESAPAYYISSKETKATAIIAKIQKPQ